MPTGVPLQQLPNQTFSVTLDGNLYDITIKAAENIMSVSFLRNGADIIDNVRAVAAGALIQGQYQEAGNFLFLTANNQLPDYNQFGLTQSLLYFSAAELAAFRTPPTAASPLVPTVTEAFFNPIAALPLRFAPQGYTEAV